MSTDRCSCRRSAQSSSADEKIWRQTISDCYFHPPLRATPATTRVINIATAGDDASSLESLDPEESIPGFIELVTNRSPAEPRWLHRLRRGRKAVEDDQSYAFCLNLADVQRMHLRLLQGRLAWLALSAGFDDDHGASQGVLSELGPTLRDYVQAVRDHEYMGRFSTQPSDPFRISSERAQERWVLDEMMKLKLKRVRHFRWCKPMAKPTGPWEDGRGAMQPVGGTRGEAFRRAVWSRAVSALVGAAFLIGPMWILVLKQDIYLQLGLTTGCIAIFGLVMVVALSTIEAVFTATLAYAAVLMVFVGVVMQSLGGSS